MEKIQQFFSIDWKKFYGNYSETGIKITEHVKVDRRVSLTACERPAAGLGCVTREACPGGTL